jgi:hypothetical protein
MRAKNEDYIFALCLIWNHNGGFFIIVTREVMLLIGLAFPLLIIMLIQGGNNRKYSLVLQCSSGFGKGGNTNTQYICTVLTRPIKY